MCGNLLDQKQSISQYGYYFCTKKKDNKYRSMYYSECLLKYRETMRLRPKVGLRN